MPGSRAILGLSRAFFSTRSLGRVGVVVIVAVVGLVAGCESTPVVVPDADQDGFPADQDCDDTNADAFPGALELCDGADNDCDGAVDVGALDADPFWPDADDDGFGDDSAEPVMACVQPDGTFVDRAGDCDDTDITVYPGRVELCNGIDDDCSGVVDDSPNQLWYPDLDADGFGDETAVVATCDPDPALIVVGGDCDDSRDDVFDGADEVCDGVDNDCDGLIDDDDPDRVMPPSWFPDADEDGFGSDAFSVEQCEPPAGSWAQTDDDCDDFVATTFPGALEVCNGVDDDCDGLPDPPDAPGVGGVSVALELSAAGSLDQPVFAVPIDLQSTFENAGGTGPVDVDALQVFVGACATGQDALPVRFLDAWSGARWDDLQPDPDADGVGALVVSWDPDPTAVDVFEGPVVTGALHFAPGAGVGSAGAVPGQLGSGAVTLDVSDGGHLIGLSASDGPVSLDQSVFQPRLDTPAGTVFLQGGTASIDAHPALSSIRFEGVADNAVADVSWDVQWWVASGSPTAVGRLQMTTQGDTTLVGPVTWQDGVVALAAGTSDAALSPVDVDSAQLLDGSAGLLALQPPGVFTSGSTTAGLEWVEVRGSAAPGPLDTPVHTVASGVVLAEMSTLWAAPGSGVGDLLDEASIDPVLTVGATP